MILMLMNASVCRRALDSSLMVNKDHVHRSLILKLGYCKSCEPWQRAIIDQAKSKSSNCNFYITMSSLPEETQAGNQPASSVKSSSASGEKSTVNHPPLTTTDGVETSE